MGISQAFDMGLVYLRNQMRQTRGRLVPQVARNITVTASFESRMAVARHKPIYEKGMASIALIGVLRGILGDDVVY